MQQSDAANARAASDERIAWKAARARGRARQSIPRADEWEMGLGRSTAMNHAAVPQGSGAGRPLGGGVCGLVCAGMSVVCAAFWSPHSERSSRVVYKAAPQAPLDAYLPDRGPSAHTAHTPTNRLNRRLICTSGHSPMPPNSGIGRTHRSARISLAISAL